MPEMQSNEIYVSNLPINIHTGHLEDYFGEMGQILGVELRTGYGPYGFVEFETKEQAERAVQRYDGGLFLGNRIRCQLSRRGNRDACFKCGQSGHWVRECPNEATDPGSVSRHKPLRVNLENDESEQQSSGPRAERSAISVSSSTSSLAPIADVGAMITWISPLPVKVDGHFCDVFEGTHSTAGRVALKRPRIGSIGNNAGDVIRRFQREAETWARLQHPHILEYLGSFQRGEHYYFVSPFIENGTLVEYIKLHLSVNRVKLLCETADAIAYLHQQDIVHGDIKASNLLIGDSGQVLLCDFGLTRATDFKTSTAMKGAGTLRWQSPELWDGGSKSFESDVYAFGMTVAEALTGEIPFPELQTDGAVIRAVLIEGKRPPKNPAVSSTGLSYENVWAVAEACWCAIPKERIPMSEGLQRIQEDPGLAAMQNI